MAPIDVLLEQEVRIPVGESSMNRIVACPYCFKPATLVTGKET